MLRFTSREQSLSSIKLLLWSTDLPRFTKILSVITHTSPVRGGFLPHQPLLQCEDEKEVEAHHSGWAIVSVSRAHFYPWTCLHSLAGAQVPGCRFGHKQFFPSKGQILTLMAEDFISDLCCSFFFFLQLIFLKICTNIFFWHKSLFIYDCWLGVLLMLHSRGTIMDWRS